MKLLITILFFCVYTSLSTTAQQVPVSVEQQLEDQTSSDETETEDDSYLQALDIYKKDPINLNTAGVEELKQLKIITDLQIDQLLTYRKIFGVFIDIYELQAVPAWDIITIHKLLPFITISSPVIIKDAIKQRFSGGDHQFLLRLSQVMQKEEQATNPDNNQGAPLHAFFRYRYNYKNLLQFGLAGDKDAGEQFLKGAQWMGFDFYSFHFFARKLGIIQTLALGDFTVNFGQGLIQWLGMAFKKSVETINVKRQSPVLMPYNSAGEYFFHRGAGVTIKKNNFQGTLLYSVRKLSANYVPDPINGDDYVSSLQTSGYHRTSSEIADRNILSQTCFGGNLTYKIRHLHIGFNGIHYIYSLPIEKKNDPYNLYAFRGKQWYNVSVDYDYTIHNIHLFGETAIDKDHHSATINGLLISVDSRVDVSLLFRAISPKYQSINGNAFTENTSPTNETGFYTGITMRPGMGLRIDAYTDIYQFPWLKSGVDAPGRGKEFLVQLTYTIGKQTEIYSRFRSESKQINKPDNDDVTDYVIDLPKKNWRTQIEYKLNKAITLRNRVELVWYDRKQADEQSGFLVFYDFAYKPLLKPYAGIVRLQYFETDGFNSRVYAYENDVLYSYSIPASSGKGFRYYVLLNQDVGKKISIWLRIAQTIFTERNLLLFPTKDGNKKTTEMKLQVRWTL